MNPKQTETTLLGDTTERLTEARNILAADGLPIGASVTVEAAGPLFEEEDARIVFLCFANTAALKNFLFDLYRRSGGTALSVHQLIVLCAREEAEAAAALVHEDLVDDYFIYRPIYDRNRFLLLLRQAEQRITANHRSRLLEEEHRQWRETLGELERLAQEADLYGEELADELRTIWGKTHLRVDQALETGDLAGNGIRKRVATAMAEGRESSLRGTADTFASLQREHTALRQQLTDQISRNDPAIVLVVDDDAKNRKVLRLILTSAGFAVREAGNGFEAVRIVERQPPALVLMDIMMPELDGLQATAIIRRHHPNLPILMVSAYSRRELVERARRLQVDGFVAKPVNRQHLLETIANILPSPSSRKAAQ